MLKPSGKFSFLFRLPPRVQILDVGCGNNSPYLTKQVLPQCNYTGIDVGDHNQTRPNLADQYVVSSPQDFADQIARLGCNFDAVISAHNIEHCEDRSGTIQAMLKVLRPGGQIYISFPSQESMRFPSRGGTLNYLDDNTHKGTPPDFDEIILALKREGLELTFATRRYQPAAMWIAGLINEPFSKLRRRCMFGTWEFYGFESVIWATKRGSSQSIDAEKPVA
jgi:SAM-dependent methyltransferase